MKPFLIEIGSEEIPARFVSRGIALLRNSLTELFSGLAIEYTGVTEYSTPRRLTLLFEGVAEKQRDRVTDASGPPRKAAFDAEGKPTKAAEGFARSMNVSVSDLKVKETERGEYVYVTIEEKGRPVPELLAEELPGIITSLQLPKSMRWGSTSLRYFRPIQWILALFGEEVIEFKVDGITSSNITYGHRFLSPSAVTIPDTASYHDLLAQNHVVADPVRRQASIAEGIRAIEQEKGCRVHKDDELLETVTNLVEYPNAVCGTFEDKYISLPKELLITVMRSHQKYFSLEDSQGNMLPHFIVTSNTRKENDATVRRGAERVLRARLEDARFYFTEDQKRHLREYTEDLKQVTFQEKLGSVHAKVERTASLCSYLAEALSLPAGKKLCEAAMLSKADLVTGVVGEFPELQGYMGMTYALNSGVDPEVASALYEHYLPRFAGDSLPASTTGSILSIADKMDTIASFFSLGKIPTGSEDPFALRRQAIGIINILQFNNYRLALNTLIHESLNSLVPSAEQRTALSGDILLFFRQRLEGIYASQGHSHDVVRAALAGETLDVQDTTERLLTMEELKKKDAFPALLMAAKRTCNILSKAAPGDVDASLFTEPSESALHTAINNISGRIEGKDFDALFELQAPINDFFDRVLVMDKDEKIRNNRLALLQSVKSAFDALGDFSQILE